MNKGKRKGEKSKKSSRIEAPEGPCKRNLKLSPVVSSNSFFSNLEGDEGEEGQSNQHKQQFHQTAWGFSILRRFDMKFHLQEKCLDIQAIILTQI